MATRQPLSGRLIGISISESPDLAALGYSMRHLNDAAIGIARHLLAAGAQVVYGGDLRPGGFTEALLDLVATYQGKLSEERPSFINYLPLPVYALIKGSPAFERLGDVEPYGRHVPLGMEGQSLSARERDSVEHREFSPREWATALTAVRGHLAKECHGRIILGGQVVGYKGCMPGIAEEALLTLEMRKPLFVLGAFGGCAADIAAALELTSHPVAKRPRDFPERARFQSYRPRDLRCGLTDSDTRILASTPHIGEAVTLLLRGMNQIFDSQIIS